MKYSRLVAYVSEAIWAIVPEKLHEIVAVLSFRAAGHEFTPEEIEARLGSARGGAATSAGKGVAVIPIRGVIAHRMGLLEQSSGGASTEGIGQMVDAAMADDSIGSVIYDVDSPGGTVTGVQELAAKIFNYRGQKKQIAHVNGMAASAAYWLASQADELVSIPSGRAGSIGVYTAHADLSAALEKEGVKVTVISAGKHKVEGQPYQPLSAEALAFLQSEVDEAYGLFVKDVARGRGVSVSDVKHGYGEGRALTAKDAKAAGLIDRIDTFEGTVARLIGKSAGALRAEDVTADADRRMRLERF
jgi:capsid assembly protease